MFIVCRTKYIETLPSLNKDKYAWQGIFPALFALFTLVAPAHLRLKKQKPLKNPFLTGAGSFAGAEMRPDKERPAENTAVLSRDLTMYGPISARQNRICPAKRWY